jgi:hypothetical protein
LSSQDTSIPYYDYAHGYGIPQAGFFLDSSYQENRKAPTFTMEILDLGELWIKPDSISTSIPVTTGAWSGRSFVYEYDDEISEIIYGSTDNYIYVHVRNSSGVLRDYRILEIKADFLTYETDSHFLEQGKLFVFTSVAIPTALHSLKRNRNDFHKTQHHDK